MISFEDVLKEDTLIEIDQYNPPLETIGWFTTDSVDRDTVPKWLYAYDLVESDEKDGEYAAIKETAVVNHGGTVLLRNKLTLQDGRLNILYFDETNEDEAQADWTYTDYDVLCPIKHSQKCGATYALKRVGETRGMKCGLTATITKYYNRHDITVLMSDGTLVLKRTYTEFTRGEIDPARVQDKYKL